MLNQARLKIIFSVVFQPRVIKAEQIICEAGPDLHLIAFHGPGAYSGGRGPCWPPLN